MIVKVRKTNKYTEIVASQPEIEENKLKISTIEPGGEVSNPDAFQELKRVKSDYDRFYDSTVPKYGEIHNMPENLQNKYHQLIKEILIIESRLIKMGYDRDSVYNA